MDTGVNEQVVAQPEKQTEDSKQYNFRRLEAARDQERDARIRAEMELQHMQQRMSSIESRFAQPEKDPLDDVEDYVDKDRLKAKLARERDLYKREAEEIAKRTYEELQQKERKTNYLQRLQDRYDDYDDLMNEDNIAFMSQTNPEFAQSLSRIPDEYERRELAYKHIKRSKGKDNAKHAVMTKIDENQRNPYHIPHAVGSGVTNSGSVNFNPQDKAARTSAYEALKAAQRRPIGGSQR